MILRKKTVRKRSKKKKYFGIEEHKAIQEYQNTELEKDKHGIYMNKILPAFDKLAENLIFIHGFARTPQKFESLKNDCVTFLYETIHKFDPDRGTKAFSYFNVVAKNWLIIQSKKAAQNKRRHISIDSSEEFGNPEVINHSAFIIGPTQDHKIMIRESNEELQRVLSEIKSKVKPGKETRCIEAIIALFEKIDDIDLLNKRAIFIYLREISSLTPKQLSVAMSSIRKHYREISKTGSGNSLFFG